MQGALQKIVRSVAGRFGLNAPWLLVILAVLTAVNVLVPDPIPFLDEVILALLTVVAALAQGQDRPAPVPTEPVRDDP